MTIDEVIWRLENLAKYNKTEEVDCNAKGLSGMESYHRGKKQAFETAVKIVKEFQEATSG